MNISKASKKVIRSLSIALAFTTLWILIASLKGVSLFSLTMSQVCLNICPLLLVAFIFVAINMSAED